MKRTPCLAILISLCVAGSTSAAGSARQELAHRMMKAKNAFELENVRRQYKELRVLRLACRIELKEEQVPTSCYAALQAESQWSGQKTDQQELRRQLDHLCQRASRKFHLPRAKILSPAVSEACRRDVEENLAIEAYRASAQSRWSED